MSIAEIINPRSIVDAFFDGNPQYAGLENIRNGLVSLVEVVFDKVKQALVKNTPVVTLRGAYVVSKAPPAWYDASAEKISTLFNQIIGQHFGLTMRVESAGTQDPLCYVTWSARQDTALRNLLSVPRILDPDSQLHQLNAQRKRGEHTDVCFTVEGQVFYAHKAIISKNPFFNLLLEKEQGSRETPIVLERISTKLCEDVFEYLYTGRVFFREHTTKDFITLALAAERFALAELKELCHLRLLCSLSPENIWEIARFAKSNGDKILFRSCLAPQASEPVLDPRMLVEICWEQKEPSQPGKKFLTCITKKVVDAVQQALATGVAGAFIYLEDSYRTLLHHAGELPLLISSMQTTLFTEILGLKISENLYPPDPLPRSLFVTWDPEQDKDLRCLFGVPYKDEPTDGERHLNKQRRLRQNTDITFEVGRKTFAAHKCILSRNEYFSSLFQNDTTRIHVTDTEPEIFEALISYLYTGEIFFSDCTLEDVMKLAMLANTINIPNLKKLCHFRLISTLTIGSFPKIDAYVRHANDKYLLRACELFAQKNLPLLSIAQRTSREDPPVAQTVMIKKDADMDEEYQPSARGYI